MKLYRKLCALILMTLLVLGASIANVAASDSITNKSDKDEKGKQTINLKTGIKMKYLEAGPKDAQVLILLHGLTDSSRSWSMSLPYLAKDYHVYVLDQRGHGDSQSPLCCYTIPDFANDVIAFMDEKKIDKAAIAGHSMGSFIAQHIAEEYPDRLSKLVLVASSDNTLKNETLLWLWENIKMYNGKFDSKFIDEWTSNATPVDPDFLAKVKVETAAVPIHVWKSATKMLMTEYYGAFLSEIKAPTLILWGDKDAVFPKADQDRLRVSLPGAAFKLYPGIGHNVQWEIPKQVADDIAAFLKANQ